MSFSLVGIILLTEILISFRSAMREECCSFTFPRTARGVIRADLTNSATPPHTTPRYSTPRQAARDGEQRSGAFEFKLMKDEKTGRNIGKGRWVGGEGRVLEGRTKTPRKKYQVKHGMTVIWAFYWHLIQLFTLHLKYTWIFRTLRGLFDALNRE